MSASELTVRKRVTEILNACSPGTFSEAVDINYQDRNSLAIRQAVKEAALMIAKAIIANPNHSHRGVFISSTPTALTHQGEVPDACGEMDLVQIQPYSGADWITGVPREVQQVESYRENVQSLYSDLNHNIQYSPLSGYYSIANGRFYFTGNAARGYFPLIDMSTLVTVIPDEYEPTWVCLAVGLTPKEGDNLLQIADYYKQIGVMDLATITVQGNVTAVPSPELARQARGDT